MMESINLCEMDETHRAAAVDTIKDMMAIRTVASHLFAAEEVISSATPHVSLEVRQMLAEWLPKIKEITGDTRIPDVVDTRQDRLEEIKNTFLSAQARKENRLN